MNVSELKENDNFSGVLFCKEKTVGQTKSGKEYYNVTLMDNSGLIAGKIWEVSSSGISNFEKGDFVFVVAKCDVYQEKTQLNITDISIAKEGTYTPEDFFPKADMDIQVMINSLKKVIATVKNPYLMELLNSFFNEEGIKKFSTCSAAKTVHHAFVGGLLQHSLNVATNCFYLGKVYKDMVDQDLLLTAGLLHDIGKITTMTDFPDNDYTDAGRFLGHIYLGSEMIREKSREIKDFPNELLLKLQHCILSHHGTKEQGSPVLPTIPEAFIIHYADELDSRMEIVKEEFKTMEEANGWSNYNHWLSTGLYKG